MTVPVTPERSAASPATYEEVVDDIVEWLRRKGAVASALPTPWDSFLRLSALVHEGFEIPSTTITPVLRRLLFAIGLAAAPQNVVGVGTYVGYAFAWLLRDRSDPGSSPFIGTALGIDVDLHANQVARRNCALLGHGARLRFADADGTVADAYPAETIDLLYLDLDDPGERKAGYVRALDAACGRLGTGALILAHDPCVPKFAKGFAAYHEFVRASSRLRGPWILPVDECGISIATAA